MMFVRPLGLLLAFVFITSGIAAAEPFKIAFVGDSMADGVWGSMQRRIARDACLRNVLQLGRFAEIGTGLARRDKFDWVTRARSISAQFTPDVFVVSIGLNDRNSAIDPEGRTRVEINNPNWQSVYKDHISLFLTEVMKSNVTVIWLGLPVLRDDAANRDALEKNRLYRAAVAAVNHPRVIFLEPWRLSGGDTDFYQSFFTIGDSKIQLRATDGIHFTTAGYDLIAQHLWPQILSTYGVMRGRSAIKDVECLYGEAEHR